MTSYLLLVAALVITVSAAPQFRLHMSDANAGGSVLDINDGGNGTTVSTSTTDPMTIAIANILKAAAAQTPGTVIQIGPGTGTGTGTTPGTTPGTSDGSTNTSPTTGTGQTNPPTTGTGTPTNPGTGTQGGPQSTFDYSRLPESVQGSIRQIKESAIANIGILERITQAQILGIQHVAKSHMYAIEDAANQHIAAILRAHGTV